MKPCHSSRFLRGTPAWGALVLTLAAHATSAEDVRAAETALREGDLPLAMTLLRRAADQDDPLAQARLGDLLRSAGLEAEAVVLYRKSAARGEPAGETGLGRAYADGAGVPADAAAALEWYRRAEARNYGPACDALARAYRTGTLGLPRDEDKAREYEARALAWQKTRTAGAAP